MLHSRITACAWSGKLTYTWVPENVDDMFRDDNAVLATLAAKLGNRNWNNSPLAFLEALQKQAFEDLGFLADIWRPISGVAKLCIRPPSKFKCGESVVMCY